MALLSPRGGSVILTTFRVRITAAGLHSRVVAAKSYFFASNIQTGSPQGISGHITSLGHESFALRADLPARFLVRMHFSRYLVLSQGAGCVARAPGGWISVIARAPGTLIVRARFSLSRALGLESACR